MNKLLVFVFSVMFCLLFQQAEKKYFRTVGPMAKTNGYGSVYTQRFFSLLLID